MAEAGASIPTLEWPPPAPLVFQPFTAFECFTTQMTAEGNCFWEGHTRSDVEAQREKGQTQNTGRKLLWEGCPKAKERVWSVDGSSFVLAGGRLAWFCWY